MNTFTPEPDGSMSPVIMRGPANKPPRVENPWQRLIELVGNGWAVTAAPAVPDGPFCLTTRDRGGDCYYGKTPDLAAAAAVQSLETAATIDALIHAHRDCVSLIDGLVGPPLIGHRRYDNRDRSANHPLIDELRELRDVLAADLVSHGLNADGTPHIV